MLAAAALVATDVVLNLKHEMSAFHLQISALTILLVQWDTENAVIELYGPRHILSMIFL